MSSPTPVPDVVPPGVIATPQGDVVALAYSETKDYPRLVFGYPRFEPIAIAEIIQPSVMEACQALLPSLVPPYTAQAAQDAVQALAVQLVGSTMTGPLMLSPAIPTAPTMAATKQYVDTMVATVVPEVPPVPANQAWARETGQWIPLAGGGTVTNIATGAGLTGGPITSTGTIAMASMAANSLKGNNTGAVAAPTDIPAGNVLTMIGAAPLASPVFTGTPVLPTGTTGVTQAGGTSNTSLATTAFVASAVGNYLPLTGGRLSGGLASGPAATTVPGLGALTLNANTVAPPTGLAGNLYIVGADTLIAGVAIDCFNNTPGSPPILITRKARGTAGSQAAVVAGDELLSINSNGYGTAYGNAAGIAVYANETWTGAAHGSTLQFTTNVNGTTSAVASLALQGNNANFSGNVILAGNYLYMAGSGGQLGAAGGPFIYGDANALVLKLGSGTTGFAVQNNAGTSNPFTVAPNGLVATPYGYNTKAGTGGAATGNAFNLSWGASGPMHLWVDTVDEGAINTTPCDMRLKKNLAPPSVDALAAINAITLRQFDWLENDLRPEHHEDIGFTAQQLAEAIPNAVTVHEDEDQMLSVQLTPIVAHLIGAVQQLSAKVAALEGRA